MHSAIESMLEKYNCKNPQDYKNALKEIIQEIALLGLSKSGFFNQAAFYGGSALRIFYNLDRFSEDIDFTLMKPNSKFTLAPYCTAVSEELGAYGFEMSVSEKEKKNNSTIESAFIKGGTLIHLLKISSLRQPVTGVHPDEIINVKLEIDISPPSGAKTEIKYGLNPIPYLVRLYDLPSLFAGKIHSILCRRWKIRVKGRDLYDYIWFLSKNTSVNIFHLEKRMKQSGHLKENETLTPKYLAKLLNKKFEIINYKQAVNDVKRFVKNTEQLNLWSKDFFQKITKEKLK